MDGKNFEEVVLSKETEEIYIEGLPYEEDGKLILDIHYYEQGEKKARKYQSMDHGVTWIEKN